MKKGIPTQVLADRSHPVRVTLRFAFQSPGGFARFEQAVQSADAAGRPAMPATMRWLKRNAPQVRAQVAMRRSGGPHSTGAVEATLSQINRAFQDRSSLFTNRRRTARLLDLLGLGLNGRDDELTWAEKLRRYLLARDGVAPWQRQDDDPVGHWSLLS